MVCQEPSPPVPCQCRLVVLKEHKRTRQEKRDVEEVAAVELQQQQSSRAAAAEGFMRSLGRADRQRTTGGHPHYFHIHLWGQVGSI